MPKLTHSLAAADSRRLLRERTGRAHVLLAGRAASAIWATLRALDLHDRPVLLPANTCYIALWAVLQSGNQPILVDVDPLTANITPKTLDQVGIDQPAVVIPAHMYGLPANMPALIEWAREHNAFVIEDAALALGTWVMDRPAGSWGDVSIFSFGQGKIADAGRGGALLTDDAHLAAEIERILANLPLWSGELERLNRQWLELYWPLHQFESANPRLLELYPTLFSIFGAITRCRLPQRDLSALRHALSSLDANLAQRAELAALYDEKLSAALVRLFARTAETTLWRYPLLVPSEHRDALLETLWSEGIHDATRWYPSLQPMCRALAPESPMTRTPNADLLAASLINLPLSLDTERSDAARAAGIVVAYFQAL